MPCPAPGQDCTSTPRLVLSPVGRTHSSGSHHARRGILHVLPACRCCWALALPAPAACAASVSGYRQEAPLLPLPLCNGGAGMAQGAAAFVLESSRLPPTPVPAWALEWPGTRPRQLAPTSGIMLLGLYRGASQRPPRWSRGMWGGCAACCRLPGSFPSKARPLGEAHSRELLGRGPRGRLLGTCTGPSYPSPAQREAPSSSANLGLSKASNPSTLSCCTA